MPDTWPVTFFLTKTGNETHMNYYLLSEQDLDELAWEIEDFNLFLGG